MLISLLLACSVPPSFVDKRMIDEAHPRADTVTICAGLLMDDDKVRSYAAEKLATWSSPESCLCESLQREGKWDRSVLKGMSKATDDDHAACAATLLDDPAQPERGELVKLLVGIKVPAVQARLKQAAKADTDAGVRATAMSVLRPEKDPEALTLLTTSLTDPSPAIRAAAATALAGAAPAQEALAAAAKDADPAVRGAALSALRSVKGFAYADLACPALASDPDPIVRAAVATSMKGTQDPALLGCLREKMLVLEPDASVRGAMLATLQSSSSTLAADTLCDAIPFWVRNYVGEERVEREGPNDILFAQNNRDFNRSYECVQRALKAGGLKTCEQRFYVNDWFHELGGKNAKPNPCRSGGGSRGSGGGGGEITF